MTVNDLLLEARNINMKQLDSLVKNSKKPIYVVVAGSVGSGKSYVVQRDLDVDTIDPDEFTKQLGDGVYDGKNVAKSMTMVKKEVADRLKSKKTFLQQGTSANLQSTINKLKNAKKHGFRTVLLYIDTPIEQAMKQVEKRVADGGHGATIDTKKVTNTSNGARLTFRALSGVDLDQATEEDLERVEKALEKTEKTLDGARKHLDFFIRVDNKY
jgi:predicted ABC-type ATPase